MRSRSRTIVDLPISHRAPRRSSSAMPWLLCVVLLGVTAALLVPGGVADQHHNEHHDHHNDEQHQHSPNCGHNAPQNREFLKSKQETFMATRKMTVSMRANMELVDAETAVVGNPPAVLMDEREAGYSPTKAIRILANYRQMGPGGPASATIRDVVMPRAITELQRRISVKVPVSETLRLPVDCTSAYMFGNKAYCIAHDATEEEPGLCGFDDLGIVHEWKYFDGYQRCRGISDDTCTDFPGQEGAPNTDFIVYVTSQDVACEGSTIAYAGACKQDPVSGRPLAGYVNFCPQKAASSSEEILLDTAVHEMLHALFFNDALMEDYIDDAGETLGPDRVMGTDYAGRRIVKSPKVVEKARELYGCDSVDGVPLEDGGSASSSSSHWEMSHVQDDIMSPSASQLQRLLFGPLTMALIEDTGWYEANWDLPGYLGFGKGAGCDFLGASCSDFADSHAEQDFFCSEAGDFGCSHDGRYMSVCAETQRFHPGCLTHKPYYTEGSNSVQSNSICFDSSNHEDGSLFGFYYGQNSRCIPFASQAQYLELPKMYSRDSAVCMQMSCTDSGALQVTIDGSTLDCPTGSTIDLAGIGSYRSGSLGPCPDNAAMCRTLGCPGDCNGNGVCEEGVCHCFLGRSGEDCGAEICSPGSCADGLWCDSVTGICRDGPPAPTASYAAAPLPDRTAPAFMDGGVPAASDSPGPTLPSPIETAMATPAPTTLAVADTPAPSDAPGPTLPSPTEPTTTTPAPSSLAVADTPAPSDAPGLTLPSTTEPTMTTPAPTTLAVADTPAPSDAPGPTLPSPTEPTMTTPAPTTLAVADMPAPSVAPGPTLPSPTEPTMTTPAPTTLAVADTPAPSDAPGPTLPSTTEPTMTTPAPTTLAVADTPAPSGAPGPTLTSPTEPTVTVPAPTTLAVTDTPAPSASLEPTTEAPASTPAESMTPSPTSTPAPGTPYATTLAPTALPPITAAPATPSPTSPAPTLATPSPTAYLAPESPFSSLDPTTPEATDGSTLEAATPVPTGGQTPTTPVPSLSSSPTPTATAAVQAITSTLIPFATASYSPTSGYTPEPSASGLDDGSSPAATPGPTALPASGGPITAEPNDPAPARGSTLVPTALPATGSPTPEATTPATIGGDETLVAPVLAPTGGPSPEPTPPAATEGPTPEATPQAAIGGPTPEPAAKAGPAPTGGPTPEPTAKAATGGPTPEPTDAPAPTRTGSATPAATGGPTPEPTAPAPTGGPTPEPTGGPTQEPTASAPTGGPTPEPTGGPTPEPTAPAPSGGPTPEPTGGSTPEPTAPAPTGGPTPEPTGGPTPEPTAPEEDQGIRPVETLPGGLQVQWAPVSLSFLSGRTPVQVPTTPSPENRPSPPASPARTPTESIPASPVETPSVPVETLPGGVQLQWTSFSLEDLVGPPMRNRRLASSMEPPSLQPESSIDDTNHPNQEDAKETTGGRLALPSQRNGSTGSRAVPTRCRHSSVLTWRLLLEIPGLQGSRQPGKGAGNRLSADATHYKDFPIGSLFFVEAEPTIQSLLSLEAERLGQALPVVELSDVDWSHSKPRGPLDSKPLPNSTASSKHEDPAPPSGVLLIYSLIFEGADTGAMEPFLHEASSFGSTVVAFLQDYFDQLYGVTRVSAAVSDKITNTDDDGCSATGRTTASLLP